MCGVAFIRNRRDKFHNQSVKLIGAAPPDNAYYPEVRFHLAAIWCPGCGLIKSIQAPELGLNWTNPEIEEYRRRQATGNETAKPIYPAT